MDDLIDEQKFDRTINTAAFKGHIDAIFQILKDYDPQIEFVFNFGHLVFAANDSSPYKDGWIDELMK